LSWSLETILSSLHDDIQSKLDISRKSFAHSTTKGDASEEVWLELFQNYLPKRYQAEKAHVVDSQGNFSDQIDIVVFDRQYSPFIFNFKGELIIPAESVYAVFESKQTMDLDIVRYAGQKVASVRKLHRTSLPIPHAGGTFPAKPLMPIYGGLLTFESDWKPALGDALSRALKSHSSEEQLDIGCVAARGYFLRDDSEYVFQNGGKPATSFLFKLISMLQFSGTVPMIDVLAYSKWLNN
jgi:hypothetical protein